MSEKLSLIDQARKDRAAAEAAGDLGLVVFIDGFIAGAIEADPVNFQDGLTRSEFYKRACIKQNGEIEVMVARAMPHRFPYDEEYGYVTGDHVAETMVQVLVKEYLELRSNNGTD